MITTITRDELRQKQLTTTTSFSPKRSTSPISAKSTCPARSTCRFH